MITASVVCAAAFVRAALKCRETLGDVSSAIPHFPLVSPLPLMRLRPGDALACNLNYQQLLPMQTLGALAVVVVHRATRAGDVPWIKRLVAAVVAVAAATCGA